MHTVLPPQYAGVAPEQKQQLLRIMNMTEGEIGVLPADQRNQVLKLVSHWESIDVAVVVVVVSSCL